MRSLFRRAIVAGSCLALWAGCSAKQQSEYVTGISTQVTVPRDLKSVLVEVSIGGVQQFCRAYRVYDGKVQLPRSLGTFAQNTPSADPITYTIIGISEAFTDSSTNPLFDGTCTNLAIGQNNARILRRSRQPYIENEILFLPMPLKYACVDTNCTDDQTCKGGKCVDATLSDAQKAALPRYTPDLSDGTGGTCFHVSAFKAPDGTTDIPGCMTAALPALTVDASKCIYAVPNTPSAPAPSAGQTSPFSGPSSGDGVNVQVTFDGIVKEILDTDPDEGFTIPDPTKPQQFQLAPGLCDMVKGANGATHQITNIRTSGTCQAKRLAQPLCAADQNAAMGLDPTGVVPNPPPADICENIALPPRPSALMLVVDDSASGASFFKALIGGTGVVDPDDDIVGPAVTAVFKNPSFSQTTVGLFYTTTNATPAMCSIMGDADPAFGVGPLSVDTVDAKFDLVRQHTANAAITDSDIAGGLTRAYNELAKPAYTDDVARSVIVFSNHFGDGPSCSEPKTSVQLATDAKSGGTQPVVTTYAMQIVQSPPLDITSPTTDAFKLAQAGGTNVPAYKVVVPGGAGARFKDVLHDLATCDYVVPNTSLKHAVDGTESLSWFEVATGAANATPPAFNAACTTRGAAVDGWGFTAGATSTQIHLCGSACTNYQASLDAGLTLGGLYATPAPAIPIYFRRGDCTTP